MREIHVSAITDTVAELAVAACCRLPDVCTGPRVVCGKEASPSGKDVLRQLLLNADIAASENTPICQDTGLAPSCSPKSGQDVHVVGGSFEEAVNAGVAKGYTEGYLRKSSVAEPLSSARTPGDNTPAVRMCALCPAIASA